MSNTVESLCDMLDDMNIKYEEVDASKVIRGDLLRAGVRSASSKKKMMLSSKSSKSDKDELDFDCRGLCFIVPGG